MKRKFQIVVLTMLFSLAGVGINGALAHHDVIVYETKNGKVTFKHLEHSRKFECGKCHKQDPPEKIEVTKELAHGELCKACHQQMQGPTKCSECHVK